MNPEEVSSCGELANMHGTAVATRRAEGTSSPFDAPTAPDAHQRIRQ